MPSIRTTSLLFITATAFFALPALASAASYYVSPNGGGSTCSSASPCSLNEGINKAGAGDEVVLKDGLYRSKLETVRSGTANAPIVIRAENKRKATVRPPTNWVPHNRQECGSGSTGSGYFVAIKHSYITLRGIYFDDEVTPGKYAWFTGQISDNVHHVIVEHNFFKHSSIGGSEVNDIIYRFNEVVDTTAEAFSFGGHGKNVPANNIQVYGNIFRNIGSNAMEFKPGVNNSVAHHNIIEGSHRLSRINGEIIAYVR